MNGVHKPHPNPVIKQVRHQIKITLFTDGSMKVNAPPDFLLFMDLVSSAQKIMILKEVEKTKESLIEPTAEQIQEVKGGH